MTKTLLDEVSLTMEAPECLLPHLPYLLQDLPSLSGGEDEVVEVLREVNFPFGGTVLDLGCGRGDISIQVARAFDAEVTGVDGHPPFIEIARQSVKEAGLEQRCRFLATDLRKSLAKPARFDAVLMIAVPVLGDPAKAVGMLRTIVRDGGWIIIGDGFLEDGAPPSAEYEGRKASHGCRCCACETDRAGAQSSARRGREGCKSTWLYPCRNCGKRKTKQECIQSQKQDQGQSSGEVR